MDIIRQLEAEQAARIEAKRKLPEFQPGDTVRVQECRPMSRTKRWRLLEVLERAK